MHAKYVGSLLVTNVQIAVISRLPVFDPSVVCLQFYFQQSSTAGRRATRHLHFHNGGQDTSTYISLFFSDVLAAMAFQIELNKLRSK